MNRKKTRNAKPLVPASKAISQSKEHLTSKMVRLFPEKGPYPSILCATQICVRASGSEPMNI